MTQAASKVWLGLHLGCIAVVDMVEVVIPDLSNSGICC
jgi:hypothetical protein